ncbi:hypothetical protein ACEPAI_10126 [Sanghuangporus weigelae]
MDSLDMNNLASSLPSSAIVKAEQDTMDKFKAAAQSLTLLYRSSQKAARRNFDAGYAMALDDLLSVVQHGVSAGSDVNTSEKDATEAMSIGRILDWIEARQESLRLKTREEEEEEDERETKTKTKQGVTSKPVVGLSRLGDSRDKAAPRSTENVSSSPSVPSRRLPTGTSAKLAPEQLVPASSAYRDSSPSPTLSTAINSHPSSTPVFSSRPLTRNRLRSKHVLAPLNATSINSPNCGPGLSSDSSITSIIGAKRRHAAMLLDHSSPAEMSISLPPSEVRSHSTPHAVSGGSVPQHADTSIFPGIAASAPASAPRRRIRSSRANASPRSENLGIHDTHDYTCGEIMMEVEEDGGRERKRVARR